MAVAMKQKDLRSDSWNHRGFSPVRMSNAVTFSGMTLDELVALLRSHNVKVEVYYASEHLTNFVPKLKPTLPVQATI
jgi:hypothetical protein